MLRAKNLIFTHTISINGINPDVQIHRFGNNQSPSFSLTIFASSGLHLPVSRYYFTSRDAAISWINEQRNCVVTFNLV